MQPTSVSRSFLPITVIFVISTALLLTLRSTFESWGISVNVMIVGNVILFFATLASFLLYYKSLRNNNVQVFLRMIYGGMFLKMMICLITAFVYIVTVKKGVSKGAVFGCMFLYFLYTFVEVAILMKLSKQQKKNV
ncbi:hypothetical protein HHL16_14865 [Pseudoflavitalea sp. G-6-1-2]|uniref:hypothetical protein n=1 Tax=Pseudoflavitalea sp. G-6-1-2 TaxID=2728841 RepID=UPI00146DDB81|nr:hypothetical protein [Pseudoflavitalea sp. G-6-1-2]NML22162.1 hypothetical protein [Pseudoflavitalea sp. G-6-1-2]